MFGTEILIDSCRLIYRFIYHGGNIWMNRAIQARVRWLYWKYGMTRKEVIEYVKWDFERKKNHRKFDPEKSCLETYVLNFTYFALLTFVRQCKKHEAGGEKEIPFSHLSNDNEAVRRMGSPIDSFERQGIEGLIDEKDPEEMIIGKELMQMATDYFGDDDLAAIIGFVKKGKVAEKLGIPYEKYRKRLQRKLSKFKSIVNDNGYDLK